MLKFQNSIMNYFRYFVCFPLLIASLFCRPMSSLAQAEPAEEVVKLVGALLHQTPLQEDLRELCDEIGGRVTGSAANREAVAWGVRKFQEAGIAVTKEAFEMPGHWLEKASTAQVTGEVSFEPDIVARAFSPATPPEGLERGLLYGGTGSKADFERLGGAATGQYVLIETAELVDLAGLFAEYADNEGIEERALKAGVQGVIYMSSRPQKLLFTYFASKRYDNTLTLATMAREDALRCARVLRQGGKLRLNLRLDLETGGPFTTHNVIAEIPGSERPEEVVIIGAHLDSWGLGTGANDNGCNVGMMIDIARQMKKLGIQPSRTIRFALWNGEEQGYYGSWAYTRQHQAELDQHVMALSVDIGSGKITGFFTNGREELMPLVDEHLSPVRGLGPFTQVNDPVVGTDNFDFMLQGVANLIAVHQSANYGPHYHAASDTYDKILFPSLKLNAAIVAALTLGFANMEAIPYERHTRADLMRLMETTNLAEQMRWVHVYEDWKQKRRGRK